MISEGKVIDKLHNTSAIYFDGRKDLTKVLIEDENGNFHHLQIREDHYSICSEPGGNYLGHLTIKPDFQSQLKFAEFLGQSIMDWLHHQNILNDLIAIGCDSTNINTGWKGGVIQYIERKINRKLICLICALHTNELPLRHLGISLDGKTL